MVILINLNHNALWYSDLRQPRTLSYLATMLIQERPACELLAVTCKGPILPSLTALAITVRNVENRKSC